MAVDEGRRRDDLYEVSLRAHDQRVEVGGWVYYVRAVRNEAELLAQAAPFDEVLLGVPIRAVLSLRRLLSRRQGWIVAVVRLGSTSTWNDVTPRVVHTENLAEGEPPSPRLDVLVSEVRGGRFAPGA